MFEQLTLPTNPPTSGYLHKPAQPNNIAVVLTHGAGANCHSKLLVTVSDALASAGFTVFRFDLPFRQARPQGPPHPGTAAADREGLRQTAAQMKLFMKGPKKSTAGPRVVLAGHSYGGRQASMLLAENPEAADALLLLSYPLHPPDKPTQLRTKHFPQLTKPAFFVQGTRDPFASVVELSLALQQIPTPAISSKSQEPPTTFNPQNPQSTSPPKSPPSSLFTSQPHSNHRRAHYTPVLRSIKPLPKPPPPSRGSASRSV